MIAAFAALLLVQPAPSAAPPREAPPTAAQLYDACLVFARDPAVRQPGGRYAGPSNHCETTALPVALTIRGMRPGDNPSGHYCPPPADARDGDPTLPLAEAYLGFVDRYPDVRIMSDGLTVFVTAMVRRWPFAAP